MLGSRDAIREAFSAGLVNDGPVWMEMVRDRNLTSHVYNRSTAEAITSNISCRYLPAFQGLREQLRALAAEEQP
jgi:nucleotidyltransferase substrate binding protein (TIGR01987 family)